jgi:tRNA A64-2'-O-ribosylphosphate transferase
MTPHDKIDNSDADDNLNGTSHSTPSNPFPTTLADLHLPPNNTSLYTTLSNLKRHTLSIHNRFSSIISDSAFVEQVAKTYNLPLIANERAGSWYIPPSRKEGSVYFKSTDGHYSQWAFSLRRLNLQLLKVLDEKGGAVIVDSTRRGKGMSDALAKTVPGWVAVMNKVVFGGEGEVCVPSCVGESERSQMQARVEGWCEGFKGLGLDVQGLRGKGKPIRVVWVVNGEWDGVAEREEGKNLIVCCSASRRVRGAEGDGGDYIQGAADDSESWAKGLTAEVFWKYKDELMDAGEEELPDLIDKLVGEEKDGSSRTQDAVLIKPTTNLFLGAGVRASTTGYDLVVNCEGESGVEGKNLVDLKCHHGKHGPNSLRERAGAAHNAAKAALAANPTSNILVTCSTGKDLSVGIALILLCSFFDAQGLFSERPTSFIDKDFIRSRLAWITSSKSDANPSRATLQAVNTFLMNRPS